MPQLRNAWAILTPKGQLALWNSQAQIFWLRRVAEGRLDEWSKGQRRGYYVSRVTILADGERFKRL